MKKIIQRILLPNKIVGFFFFHLGFGLLTYVFWNHLEESFLAYASYLFSFYALLLFCIWFYRMCHFSNLWVRKSKIYQLYQKNLLLITKYSMFFSFLIHLIYGILKLILGIFFHSWWFITFAIYYLCLCFMKISLVRNIENEEKGYFKLKHTGMWLFFLNIVFIGMILLIIKQDQEIYYHGFLIYLVALYDFYLMISSFVSVLKYRTSKSPIIISSKCISLTVAMISMVSLEVAMVCQFGNNDSHFKLIMTSLMGFFISIINLWMALYMIRKANFMIQK